MDDPLHVTNIYEKPLATLLLLSTGVVCIALCSNVSAQSNPSASQAPQSHDSHETQHAVRRLPPVASSDRSIPSEMIPPPDPANVLPTWPLLAGLDDELDSISPPGIPAQFEPWWADGVARPQRAPVSAHDIGIDTLVVGAISHSPQIRAGTYLPLAQESKIIEAQSEFDLRAFVESTFDRPSDPVGNTLTTGGPSRFPAQPG